MEKMGFVRNGVLRLPPGFRFHPTDEELVVQYLSRKALSRPLPASIIPEFDVCKSDPWDLPGDSEQERYFFSTREAKYPNGNRSNRATCSGYWKATGIDKKIVSSKINEVVGMKKTLVFYKGKPPHGTRTDWIMHEYRLESTQKPMENWVLCRIFLKKRGENSLKKKGVGAVCFEFVKGRTDLNMDPSSQSSDWSGITEISSNESDHEESSITISSTNTSQNCRRKPKINQQK